MVADMPIRIPREDMLTWVGMTDFVFQPGSFFPATDKFSWRPCVNRIIPMIGKKCASSIPTSFNNRPCQLPWLISRNRASIWMGMFSQFCSSCAKSGRLDQDSDIDCSIAIGWQGCWQVSCLLNQRYLKDISLTLVPPLTVGDICLSRRIQIKSSHETPGMASAIHST